MLNNKNQIVSSHNTVLGRAIRRVLNVHTTSLCTAVLLVSPSHGQTNDSLEEVVVTGTRIVRDGYEAPTPTMVMTTEDLLLSDPGTLADGLNQLPQFRGSSQPQSGGVSANGAAGSNFLSLRNLGSQRNLVLLDGKRFVAASETGATDINLLPQNLIGRVETVTGGASAAYGSDAVAGVVNFILDRRYEGSKGSVQLGQSRHGDAERVRADFAHGRRIADGKGHWLLSIEYYDSKGIGPYDTNRRWNTRGSGRINNTTGVGPDILLVRDGAVVSAATFGGLISAGPLAGTQFDESGQPQLFRYGEYVTSTFMIGGDGIRNDRNLSAGLERWNFFTRGSYELSDSLSVNAELTYSDADTNWSQYSNYCYTSCAPTIYADNPFIPDATRQRMSELSVSSFRLHRIHDEIYIQAENQKEVWRVAVELEGRMANGWTYDAYVTTGESDNTVGNPQTMHYQRYYAAMDSYRDPGTGELGCRSTMLYGLNPGCVPFNPFGKGAPSQEALEYTHPDQWRRIKLEQLAVAASMQGELFELNARPVGFAVGAEWREESSDQTVSASAMEIVDLNGIRGGPASFDGREGPFIVGNPRPLNGSFDVWEMFAEVALPLLYDRPLVHALEVDLAARYTEYSMSGNVNTWKASLNYMPISDLRVRATRSRDIRAANVSEMFTGGSQGIGTAREPATGQTIDVVTLTGGNPNLAPEVADTVTAGVVYQPERLPGFSISVDHYAIDINGAVSTFGRQEALDECFRGNQAACGLIRVSGTLYNIDLPYMNLDKLEVAGVDYETSYSRDMLGGDVTVRFVAGRQYRNQRTTPGGEPINRAGASGNPEWQGRFSVRYQRDRMSLFAQHRYIDSYIYDIDRTEGVDININKVASVNYLDLTGTYRFGRNADYEVYLTINNLLDRDPPFAPSVSGTHLAWSNFSLFDTIGRYYNLGFRYQF